MHKKWLTQAVATAFLATIPISAQQIFVTQADPGETITILTADPVSFATSLPQAQPNVRWLLPTASAQKFYAVSPRVGEAIRVLTGTYPQLVGGARLATGVTIREAAVSPNRRYIAVAGGQSFDVFDTTDDSRRGISANTETGNDIVDVAFTADSRRVLVASYDTQRLTAFDIGGASLVPAGSLRFDTKPSAVTVAPSGMIYVSADGFFYVVSPRLTLSRSLPVAGTPGPLRFTPDGRFGIAINVGPTGSRGAFLLDTTTGAVTEISNIRFNDVAIVSNTSAYGTAETGEVYSLTIGPNTFTASQVPVTVTNARAVEASGELPTGRNVFVLGQEGTIGLNISSGVISGPTNVPQAGELIVLRPSATGTAATLTPLGSEQNVARGESGSVGVRVLGQNGQPVSGATVRFAAGSADVQLSSTEVVSDGDGVAAVTVTLPANFTPSTATITATSGGAPAQTITVNAGAALPPPGGGGSGGGTLQTGLNPVSGQGQVVADQTFNTTPLVARLTDANGQPISGASVTWNITQGGGQILNATNTTDANGEVRAQYQPAPILLPQFTPVVSASIQATASTGHSTTFYVNVLPFMSPNILVSLEQPIDSRLTIRAGQTLEDAIRVQVQSATGNAIPNAGIELVTSGDPASSPSVSCRNRFGLTNASGIGTCSVVAGPRAGTVQATLRIGNQRDLPIEVTITPGVAAALAPEAGNNQTVAPGARILNLVVLATDNFGSPIPGTQITWEIPNGFTAVGTPQTTTDVNGRAFAGLTAPQAGGNYQVRARSGNLAATFNITVSSPVSQLTKVSGDNQTAQTGAVFSQPLRVRVLNANGAPAPSVPVSFNVTSGSATVSQQTVNTDASGATIGEAVILVTAGQTTGPVVVTATAGGQSVTFNLTVAPPGPAFTLNDIMNAGSFRSGLAPGSIAYIRVGRIAPNLRGTVTPFNVVGPLPTSLAGVQVLFNGTPAPIYSVSNVNNVESVIAQVPFETPVGNATVEVRTDAGLSATVNNVPIQALAPDFFETTDSQGRRYAVATKADGSYVSVANPARPGDTIRAYLTGMGQTLPVSATNRAGIPNQDVAGSVIVGINYQGVPVTSAELLEGVVGVYVVEFQVPTEVATDPNDPLRPLDLSVAGTNGQQIFAAGSRLPIVR